MKKLLNTIVALLFLFTCCTKESDSKVADIEKFANTDFSEEGLNNVLGTTDALGQGYDITGEYLDLTSLRPSVIDIVAFKVAHQERFNLDCSLSEFYDFHYGNDALDYINNLKSKVFMYIETDLQLADSSCFSGTLISNYKNEYEYSSRYSFASCDYIKQVRRLSLNADAILLSHYLDKGFLADLESKTAEEIVQIYGTHVLTDVGIGGRLNMLYSSIITMPHKDERIKSDFNLAIFSVFGLSLDIISDADLAKVNMHKRLKYKTFGGTSFIRGEVGLEKEVKKIGISTWLNDIKPDATNAVLIGIGWKKTIPIYNLVPNATKKSELKNAVQKYIKTKKINF